LDRSAKRGGQVFNEQCLVFDGLLAPTRHEILRRKFLASEECAVNQVVKNGEAGINSPLALFLAVD